MKKGFALTLDAVIAILITSSLLAGVSYFWSDISRNELVLDRMAADVLFILDHNETLKGMDETKIDNTISDLLPSSVDYDYNITYYDVPGLTLIGSNSTSTLDQNQDILVTVRTIPIFENESSSVPIKELDMIAKAKLEVSV